MEKITRTVNAVKASIGKVVIENRIVKGEPIGEIIVTGKATQESVLKAAAKKFGVNDTLVILDMLDMSAKYEMSLETFMQHATEVPEKAAE